jgi:hypothetical protein
MASDTHPLGQSLAADYGLGRNLNNQESSDFPLILC